MRETAIAYFAAAITMASLDFCWLRLTAEPLYHRALGTMLADKVDLPAAIAFYLIYVAGSVVFAIWPAVERGDWRIGLVQGALFGFFAYATYDLTNLATLRFWSLRVSLLDIAWGSVLTSVTAGVSAFVTLALER